MAASPIQNIKYYKQVKVVYTKDVPNQTIAPVFKEIENLTGELGFPTLQKWSSMLPVIDYKNNKYYTLKIFGELIEGNSSFFISNSDVDSIISSGAFDINLGITYTKNENGFVVESAQGLDGYVNRLYIESAKEVIYDTPTGNQLFNLIKMNDGSEIITKYNLP